MARWVHGQGDYWERDAEALRKAREVEYFWEEVRSLARHIGMGVLKVGAYVGAFVGIILWFTWIVGDGSEIRWFRAATLVPVAGIVIGVLGWLNE